VQDTCAHWIVVHLVRHLDVQSIGEYVAEAIASGDGCVIDIVEHVTKRGWADHPTLSSGFLSFIYGEVNRLLHIANKNAEAWGVESNDSRAESLMKISNRFK
jgi:hypothetical protein